MIENVYQFSKTVQEVKKKEPDCRQIARTICCRQAEMPNPRTMLQTTRTTKIRAKCAPNVHQNRPQQSQKNGNNITIAVATTMPATTIKTGADGPPGPWWCADGGFVPPQARAKWTRLRAPLLTLIRWGRWPTAARSSPSNDLGLTTSSPLDYPIRRP